MYKDNKKRKTREQSTSPFFGNAGVDRNLETVVSKDNALRIAFISISGFLFVGANSAWTSLGYLNPIAWFLEWSSVILAFLCVYSAVRTKGFTKEYHGYMLIAVSLLVSAISYYPSIVETTTNAAIYKTINPFYYIVFAIPLLLIPLLILYDRRHFSAKKLAPLLFFLLVIGTMGLAITVLQIRCNRMD